MRFNLTAAIFLILQGLFAQSPTLEWVTRTTGYPAFPKSSKIDDFGNIYTIGTFSSTVDFEYGVGVTELSSNGEDDIYIQKQDVNGNLLWVKKIGGEGYDGGLSISIDDSGDIFAFGTFREIVDFDPGTGIYNLHGEGTQVFVLKLNADGEFVWVKSLGHYSNLEIGGTVLDDTGNIFLTGYFINTVDFDPGSGVFELTSTGSDPFILKLNPNGEFMWVKQLEDITDINVTAITKDNSGNIYVTGYFRDVVDFDPGSNVVNLTSVGSHDIFILKLDNNGNYIWAK